MIGRGCCAICNYRSFGR